jgi:hypothetical protein
MKYQDFKSRKKSCGHCPYISVLEQLHKPIKSHDQKSWLFTVLQIDVAIIFSFLTMNEALNFRSSCQKMYNYVRLFPWNTKALTVLPRNFRHWKVHFPNAIGIGLKYPIITYHESSATDALLKLPLYLPANTQITSLNLYGAGNKVTDKGLNYLPLESVEDAYLVHCNGILGTVFHRFENIVNLNLANCYHIPNESFQILGRLPKLKYLNLSSLYLTDVVFPQFIQKDLKLIIIESGNLRDTAFSVLREIGFLNISSSNTIFANLQFTYIHTFIANGCNLLDSALMMLHNLKRLSISSCKSITDKGLIHLSDELQELDVSYCPLVTNEGFIHLTNLIALSIDGNKQLDIKVICKRKLNECWSFQWT